MTDRPPLHVIEGTPPPDTPGEQVRQRVRNMPRPAAMPQCHRCGGREYIETKIGAGKSATKQRVCLVCMLNGQRVVIP